MFLETLSRLTKLRGHRSQAAAVAHYVGVVGAEGRLTDLKCPLQLRPGALQIPKTPQHHAEVGAADGHGRVVGAKRRLADLKRPLNCARAPARSPRVRTTPPNSSHRQATSGSAGPSAASVSASARSAIRLAR